MSETRKPNNSPECIEFQARMPELFEVKADFSKEEHLEYCENCAELVRDMQYIAEQARLLMPIHDPAPVVWENIRMAMQTEEGESR